ncbi:MAG: transcription elongation factor GreB [Xanthomonadales bacterium]|nr:transcription elongation factor GreB [Xanthomonadales bacterium]
MASPYITPEGHARLKAELDHLWRERRPEVTRALSAAAAEGDRSENAEYIYRKKELREIDRRIRYLSKRLDVLRVVTQKPADRSRIFFGARVELVDEDGRANQYRIVGADESDPARGAVSVDAPLARALLKHGVGDRVTVRTPEGQVVHTIRSIAYD